MTAARDSAGSWTRRACRVAGVSVALATLAHGQEPAGERPTAAATAEQILAAIDPAVSGWDSELLVAQVEAQLQAIVDVLERPMGETGALGICTEAFRWTAPAELATIHRSAAFRVRRGRGNTAPEASLARFLDRLRSDLGPVGDVRSRIETVQVEGEADALVTLEEVHVGARGAAGPVQLDALWRCRWRLRPDGAPLLDGLEVLRHEDIAALQGALFSDCTEGLLGGLPAWSEQLLPGLPEWRARLDSRLGLPFLGQAAGIAVGDVDGDGLEDLYLCQPGGMPNKLLLHRPDGTVADASSEANVDFLDFSRSALLLDFDGDGDRDLAVTVVDQLLFLSNDGRARFWLEAVLPAPDATSLAAADFDLDGDLDLHLCTYASPYDRSSLPVPCHDADNGKPDVFLVNHGQWVFEEASAELGLRRDGRGFSLAASWEDFDRDGDPDIHVANDFGRDELYRNDGGKFVDIASEAGAEQLAAGTGVAWGDVDGDGWMDLYVSNRTSAAAQRIVRSARFQSSAGADVRAALERHARGNALLRNHGDGSFEDVTARAGASTNRWTWGGIFCDVDVDGWEDLLAPAGFLTEERTDELSSFFWREVVARSPLDGSKAQAGREGEYVSAWSALNRLLRQGHSWSGREPNGAFLALGHGDFAAVSTCAGLDLTGDARATVRVDWDMDGDEDLVQSSRSGPRLRFLRNDQRAGNASVTLELRGTRANRDAIGARVELALATERGARTLVRSVRAGEGYLAQSSTRLTIGLGSGKVAIERVGVRWPGGASEDFTGVSARGAFRLVEGAGRGEPLARGTPAKPLAPSTPVVPPAATAARVVLVRPVPLPSLKVVAQDGNGLQLFGIQAGGTGTGTGRAVLLDLFSLDSQGSRAELGALAARGEDLARSGIACLALCVDGTERRAEVEAFLRELSWPFPWAFVLTESRRTLEALQDILLDRERPASTPQSLLVDAPGRLRIAYLGALDPDRLLADRELLELGEGALLERATPLAGRWMFPALPSDADFFEARLAERGLVDAAREYARGRLAVVQASPAELLHDFGRARAVEGKLDEAIDLFRRALAADPRHVDSLFDLAVVFHRREELAKAVALYEKVLALAPDNADARFNLALALIGENEREAAERQLAWLEAHRKESAAELRRILESTPPR